MTLQEYLEKEYGDVTGKVIERFAKKVGYSIFAVRKWRAGERCPRPRAIVKIAKVTNGQVSSNDWIGA